MGGVRGLHQFERDEYEVLLSLLSNVFIWRDFADYHIWKAIPCGQFYCKSFMDFLEDTPTVRASSSLIWLGLAPPRVEAFWLVVFGKVSTADNLRRRCIALEKPSGMCVLCRRVREDINHLFLHCEFAHFLWFHFLKSSSVSGCMPASMVL